MPSCLYEYFISLTTIIFLSDDPASSTYYFRRLMFRIWLTSPVGEGLDAMTYLTSRTYEAQDNEDLFQAELSEPQRSEDFAAMVGYLLMPEQSTCGHQYQLLRLYHLALRCCEHLFELELKRLRNGQVTIMDRVAYFCQRCFCMPSDEVTNAIPYAVFAGLHLIE